MTYYGITIANIALTCWAQERTFRLWNQIILQPERSKPKVPGPGTAFRRVSVYFNPWLKVIHFCSVRCCRWQRSSWSVLTLVSTSSSTRDVSPSTIWTTRRRCKSSRSAFSHHFTTAVRDRIRPPRRIRIRIRTPDYFQNSTGTSLSKDISVTKFSWKSDQSLRRYKPHRETTPYLIMLRNPSKNSWIRMRRRMAQFFLVHRYICGKIFMNIRSVVFT